MSSVDGKWDPDIVGDPLPPWGTGSRSNDSELDHDRDTNDSEVDRNGSNGGERTTDACGVNVVVVGDGVTNANLGDGVRDRDEAYDDDKVDHTGSSGGE